mmetsp:Transcript_10936/g.15745  ORF Transcript_10936/g.15745 Transcript_10936/m.15745 type:complete len:134 (-) Transcript_10936:25-426(-)|eukprot:CAMPEP_0172423620 /NCGR_PEP_ID=MMETSP1064-20121228/17617_1 /TAXON_ID=202472 /ORGANISM="Aulacoseira subarctica , Strain CCAP 1002/5" /LENGTH=133 /DNA_ID=CAMNT_0013165079 /DNA_START=71 /DNA_END=472 /DNA_ORIENTATION=-
MMYKTGKGGKSAWISLVTGLLIFIGGAIGYFRKGSKASLFAGAVFGGLLFVSGRLIAAGRQLEGNSLAAGVSGVMTVVLGGRYITSGKLHAGLVAMIGFASAAYHTRNAIIQSKNTNNPTRNKEKIAPKSIRV